MTSTKSGADFAVRLVHARQLASRFSKATDELNAALTDAEKALAELRLGVSASVLIDREYGDDDGRPFEYVSYLTFCKTGKAWRLLVESGPAEALDSLSSSQVCDTSRETRLLAAKQLPSLLEKLVETAEKELQEVEANAEAVRSLVQTMRGASDLDGLGLLGAEVVEVKSPVQKPRGRVVAK